MSDDKKNSNGVKIKILGTGCPNCKRLEANVKKALEELNLEATVEKVINLPEIMSYGVLSVPAIVVDDEVLSSGTVLTVKEIKELLANPIDADDSCDDSHCSHCSCC